MGTVFGKHNDYESPQYETITKNNNYEIRSYSSTIAIDGPTARDNDGNGFGNLAKYIGVFATPENDNEQAISMTAPVVTYNNNNCNNDSDDVRMQFILPSKLKSPPNPTNKDLEIKQRESAIFAVITFSGLVSHQESIQKKDEFVKMLEKDNITLIEPIDWEFWRFNPPWTIPMYRTNEIAIKVIKSQFESQGQ
eukprot:76200_1